MVHRRTGQPKQQKRRRNRRVVPECHFPVCHPRAEPAIQETRGAASPPSSRTRNRQPEQPAADKAADRPAILPRPRPSAGLVILLCHANPSAQRFPALFPGKPCLQDCRPVHPYIPPHSTPDKKASPLLSKETKPALRVTTLLAVPGHSRRCHISGNLHPGNGGISGRAYRLSRSAGCSRASFAAFSHRLAPTGGSLKGFPAVTGPIHRISKELIGLSYIILRVLSSPFSGYTHRWAGFLRESAFIAPLRAVLPFRAGGASPSPTTDGVTVCRVFYRLPTVTAGIFLRAYPFPFPAVMCPFPGRQTQPGQRCPPG